LSTNVNIYQSGVSNLSKRNLWDAQREAQGRCAALSRSVPWSAVLELFFIAEICFAFANVVGMVDVNYPDRSATTILAGGSGE
jgi:hypothetical protein